MGALIATWLASMASFADAEDRPLPAATDPPTQAELAKAHGVAAQHLLDPFSARYGGVKMTRIGYTTVFCGAVLAKNAYGGYTGARGFIIDSTGDMFVQTDENTAAFSQMWAATCMAGPQIDVPNF